MKTKFIILLIILTNSVVFAEEKEEKSLSLMSMAYVFHPNAPLGLNISKYNYRTLGYYGDFKFSLGVNKEKYYEDMNYNEAFKYYGDDIIDVEDKHYLFSGGLTYLIFKSFGIYFGAGLNLREQYTEFFDKTYTLGEEGYYYVSGPIDEEYNANFNCGIQCFGAESISILAGFDSKPIGFNIGIGYYFY